MGTPYELSFKDIKVVPDGVIEIPNNNYVYPNSTPTKPIDKLKIIQECRNHGFVPERLVVRRHIDPDTEDQYQIGRILRYSLTPLPKESSWRPLIASFPVHNDLTKSWTLSFNMDELSLYKGP